MAFGLDDIIAEGLKIINKFIPDPQAQVAAQLEMMKIKQADSFKELEVQLQEQQMQADINKVEAASDHIFVSGPRPFIMWICGVAFGLQFVLFPIGVFVASFFNKMVPVPTLPLEALMTVLLGTLGLGGYRSWEKIKGVQKWGRIMDLTMVVQILLGAIMTGFGFWVKSQRADIEHIRQQLQRTREEYVHKNDLRELKTEMSHRFDKLEELIRDKKE